MIPGFAMMCSPKVAGGGGGGTDPHWSNVVSLLHFDGADATTTFTDQTGKIWTPYGDAKIGTSQYKFGGSSGFFDGNNDYISTPSHADFDFGSGDFTIEFWLRINAHKDQNQGLVVRDRIGGTRGWLFYTQAVSDPIPGAVSFSAWVGGSSFAVTDTSAAPTGAWTHFAAAREGGTMRFFRAGVTMATASISGSIGTPFTPCVVGTLWGTSGPFGALNSLNGQMDDLRITKGVARYTANFAPPTAPFPNS